MKNFLKLFGIIAPIAIIAQHGCRCLSALAGVFAKQKFLCICILIAGTLLVCNGCPTDGGGGSGGLEGTWLDGDGDKWVLNNGNLTVSIDDVESVKGTYSTSGNNITMTFTQVSGAAFGPDGEQIGLIASQWYTRQQLRTTVINYFVSEGGLDQSEAEEIYADEMEALVSRLFGTSTGTYSLSGNTLTITTAGETQTFTRQGGTGGGGGSMTWTVVGDSKFGENGIEAIAYGGGRFVAVGSGGKIAYSTNGASWTGVSDSTFTSTIYGIAYGGGRFVAVGSGGKMAYSADGTSWTAVSDSTFGSSRINSIAYGGGKFVAGGDDGKMAYSTNGTSWTAVTDITFEVNGFNVEGIAYGNGKFVAVGADDYGNSSRVAHSTDGVAWTVLAKSIESIAYGGGRFIATQQSVLGDYIWHSTDGVTWTQNSARTPSSITYIDAFAYGNNRWVAGCRFGNIGYSSDNGITWTLGADKPLGEIKVNNMTLTVEINAIAYGGGRFIIVSNWGKIAYADW